MSHPSSSAEMSHKLGKVRHWLSARKLNAVALAQRSNFSWLTGGRLNYVNGASETGVATLVVTADRVLCLTNRIESPRLSAEELGDLGIELRVYDWFDAAAQAQCFAASIPAPAAGDVPLSSPAGTCRTDAEFDALRHTLLPEELDRYRDAGRRTGRAIERVARTFEPGITETHLAGLVAEAAWEEGVRPWVVLIASDERLNRYRHPIATDKKIEKTAMLVICGERYGLISSATRIVSFGKISDDLRRRHEACCRVDAAFLAGSKHGRKLCEVFAEGQKAYADEGFDGEWKLHHQGGLAGYSPREMVAAPDNGTVIRTPAAFAWNPSITGTKSEDTILVSPAGCEIITASADWPQLCAAAAGETFARPAILER